MRWFGYQSPERLLIFAESTRYFVKNHDIFCQIYFFKRYFVKWSILRVPFLRNYGTLKVLKPMPEANRSRDRVQALRFRHNAWWWFCDYHLKSLTTGFRVSFRNFCESSTHLIGFRLLLIGKLPRKRSRRPGPMASTECWTPHRQTMMKRSLVLPHDEKAPFSTAGAWAGE